MMSNQDTYDSIRELKRVVAQQNGLDKGYDNYFFLARIGSNYNEYGFNWEPFRDMAGPLDAGEATAFSTAPLSPVNAGDWIQPSALWPFVRNA